MIGGFLGGNSKDSKTNNAVKDVLVGLLGGNKSKEDSTSTEAKNPVKDILGGFFVERKNKILQINPEYVDDT